MAWDCVFAPNKYGGVDALFLEANRASDVDVDDVVRGA
jgi:hypothetical protein